MAQIRVTPGEAEENLARAVERIREARQKGATFVVLPECLDLGWTDPSAMESAAPIPGPRSEQLAAAARDAGVYVAAGLTEKTATGRHNAAVLIAPDGALVLHHRKINLLDIERESYTPGDRLGVTETPWGRVGLNICADNFADSLWIGEALGKMGAKLVVSPCAWAVDADHTDVEEPYQHWGERYSALVERCPMTVVGVSNVGWIRGGPWKGKKCIGCSLAIGPDGKRIGQAPYGDAAEAIETIRIP